jgi:DNA polymerase-3 subunit delta
LAKKLHLFWGEEDFLIQERVNELIKAIKDPSVTVETIDEELPTLEKLVAALQGETLFGGGRLVVIKNVDLKNPVWDELVPHLSGAQVVFWVTGANRQSKLWDYVNQYGEVLEFKSFAEWEQAALVDWIQRRVTAAGKKIDTAAAVELAQICGSGLRSLASEIDKLVTYLGDQKEISADAVMALASPGQASVFTLTEAVLNKDLRGALEAYRDLRRNRLDIFPLLSLLVTQYRTMLGFKAGGGQIPELSRALGLNPFFVKKCAPLAQQWQSAELQRAIEELLAANLRIKSGESEANVIDLLLTSLCTGPAHVA